MNDERLDLDALTDWQSERREERVVQRVMTHIGARPAPRGDLAGAILAIGRPALAAAAAIAMLAWVAPRSAAPGPTRTPTVATALGIPAAADRVIRGEQPASAHELLAALREEP